MQVKLSTVNLTKKINANSSQLKISMADHFYP